MNMTFKYIPYPTQKIVNTPVFFFVYNTDNYFHFLYDTLPYIISFNYLKKTIPNLKLLMSLPETKRFYNFVLEFLEILKVDHILLNKESVYADVYISSSYTHGENSNAIPRKEIYQFYRNIVKKANESDISKIQTPEKIYISRRTWIHNDLSNIGTNYTTRRKLVNEDEVVKYLNNIGFTEIFAEKLTTIEKICLFSKAKHIVGAIGGGLANVLFSPENCKLTALVSPTFLDVNKRFLHSLNHVDTNFFLDCYHVEQDKYKKYIRVKHKNMNIIGEIEDVNDKTLLISYTDGTNTGWNSSLEYKKIEVMKDDVELLDHGLNSAWKINIKTFKDSLK